MFRSLSLCLLTGLLAALPAAWAAPTTTTAKATPAVAAQTSLPPGPKAPPSGAAMAATCAGCHGTEGRIHNAAFMPLAGMPVDQFVRAMRDFRSGARPSTLMGHVAQGFSDEEIDAMARYFAAIPLDQGAAR